MTTLKREIAELLKEKGIDIWFVAGKDGIDQILKDELDQLLSLILKHIEEKLTEKQIDSHNYDNPSDVRLGIAEQYFHTLTQIEEMKNEIRD